MCRREAYVGKMRYEKRKKALGDQKEEEKIRENRRGEKKLAMRGRN